MVGTIVIRAMLVIALIVTAHIIKPFSITGTADRMLAVAGVVSDYLPEETRIGFNHANFLAVSLSRSLFGGRCFDGAEANDVLASNLVQPGQPTRAAKVWPPSEIEKPGRKVKPAPKRSAPAKRIDRIDNNNIASFASYASGGDDQVLWNETPINGATAIKASLRETIKPTAKPVVLPVLPAEAIAGSMLQVQTGVFHTRPYRTVCRESEVKSFKMVATLITPKRRPLEIKTILNLMNAARECENQKPDGAQPLEPPPAEVAELEDTEEAETEEIEAEAPPELPQEVTEETKPEMRLSPLQCPTDPQD